ncbi:MAG: hypothetical protein WCI02_10480 [Planctomycetota bacterium]
MFRCTMGSESPKEFNRIFTMVIRGTVHNGQIKLEGSSLPEGTQVLISPIESTDVEILPIGDLKVLKAEIHRIAGLPCENDSNDAFSGANHDKILYGN